MPVLTRRERQDVIEQEIAQMTSDLCGHIRAKVNARIKCGSIHSGDAFLMAVRDAEIWIAGMKKKYPQEAHKFTTVLCRVTQRLRNGYARAVFAAH